MTGGLKMKDYTNEEIKSMEEEFKSLLRKINRPNANIEGLIEKLENSDFFYAPASSKYHNSCFGGLVNHSLNVYNNLTSLVKMKKLENIISEESIIICALLHDMSKLNFYEQTSRNKKFYHPDGLKKDELGYFDWVAERGWSVKPDNKRFLYGSHEETSEFMVRCYIPLTLEESIAILHHHSGMSNDSTVKNLGSIYSRFPIANLLHVADMLATFTDEKYE